MSSISFLVLSRILKSRVRKTKKSYNIQEGKIEYTDLNNPAKPLFSRKYRLAGKPDYIVKQKKHFLPVELKTGGSNKPKKGHILQLAAYCQLIEDNYQGFVPYGILVYNNKDLFRIPFDPKLRFELENTLASMRNYMKAGKLVLNHNDPARCVNCSMRKHCNIKIY